MIKPLHMKQFPTLLALLLFPFFMPNGAAQTPELWGLMSAGGTDNNGAIISLKADGSNFNTHHSFKTTGPGEYPDRGNDLVLASNGKLYGTTAEGGTDYSGVLFELDPVTGIATTMYNFEYTSGGYPYGPLVEAANGKLYGMVQYGGSTGRGVLYEYTPGATSIVPKFNFDNTNGAYPYGNSLVEASNGKLYGLTASGGVYSRGVLFEYTPGATTVVKKFDFDNTNGGSPNGSLTEASNGKLYGLTSSGGVNSQGVLFEYTLGATTVVKKFDFDNTNGGYPYGSLTEAPNGKLYGMTSSGGANSRGVLFEYTLGATTVVKKFDFDNTRGSYPYGSLVVAPNGKLYGMTRSDGANYRGTVIEYTPGATTVVKKVDFDGVNAGSPYASLALANNGKLYGMTYYGGSYGACIAYTPGATTVEIVFLCQGTNGKQPQGTLVEAANGKLYGLAYQGGTFGRGTLFEYDPASSSFETKFNFDNANGASPMNSLMVSSNGKLYGITRTGGTNNKGVLFEYTPGATNIIKKYDFDGTNGNDSYCTLMEASNGKIYGVTATGGTYNYGVLFEYIPGSTTIVKKYDFNNTNGRYPYNGLVEAPNGKLYGLTVSGGTSARGILYEYTPGATTIVKKFDFNSSVGRDPKGLLTLASNGKLYGLTSTGGINGQGTLFEYTAGATTIVKKFDFNYSNIGAGPQGSLIEASNGKLYGMTGWGGNHNGGTIFEYTAGNTSCTVIKHLQQAEGSGPQYGRLLEIEVEKSWTGNTNTNWNEPTNWSMNAVPTATDNVTIPTAPVGGNMPTVNIAGAVVGDITLETSATVTIPSGMALTVDGVLTNDGTVYVHNSGSLVQNVGSTLAGSGSYQVQRQGATAQRFNFWSSPISSQNGVPGTSYTFNSNASTQDDTDDSPSDPGWSSYNGAMVPGVGYAGNGGGLATFNGTVNNGNVAVPLVFHSFDNTYSQTTPGTPFNLVGNPYPSAISASQLIYDNPNIDGTIYFWDDDLSGGSDYNRTDFAYWNGTGGLGTGAGSVGAPNGSISTGQGFYVRALNAGTLSFNNDQRVAGPNTQFFRMNGEDNRLWFSIETDSLFNQVLIGALEDATEDEDRLYDAVKMRSANGISLSAIGNNVEHAIMAFPPPADNKTIPLRVSTETNGTHMFKAQTVENFHEFALYLEDVVNGTSHELQEGVGIPVQLEAGEYLNRFYLNLVRTSFTGIENAETTAFTAYAANNLLHVTCYDCDSDATIRLIDMRGRTIIEQSEQNLKAGPTTIDLSGIGTGIYLVSVTTATQTLTQKIFKD